MSTRGFGEVPYNDALRTIKSLLDPDLHNRRPGRSTLAVLKPALLSELYQTDSLTKGIDPNEFLHEPIFHTGPDVVRSHHHPVIEIISGRNIDQPALLSSLPSTFQQFPPLRSGLNSYDTYVEAYRTGAYPSLPYASSLNDLFNFSNFKFRTPVTTQGPIGRLLTQRALFIEGLRVPRRQELMEKGFSLSELNKLYETGIDRDNYNPYLLLILQRHPLTYEDFDGELLRQTVRLIQEITSSRLTTHVTLRTVPLRGEIEQDRAAFLDALESSTESLRA